MPSARWVFTVFATVFSVGFGAPATMAAPTKDSPDSNAKKMVGVWEGTEDFGGKTETITLEFKKDGVMTINLGPFKLTGTYKVTKEDGKAVHIDSELTIEGFGDDKSKVDKKSLKVEFDDADNITVSKAGDKPDPKKFKRKK
jgi:hypothetical protein